MPKRLKDLLINRVDLVDKGDNPGASIALFKRDDTNDGGDDIDSNLFLSASDKGVEKLFQMFKNLFHKEGVKDSMPKFDVKKFAKEHGDEQLQDRVVKLSDEQLTAIAEAMEKLEEETRTPLILGYEVDKQEMAAQLAAATAKQDEDDDDEEDEEEVERRRREAANKRIPEDVWKNLSPEVRKVIEDSQKEAKEAVDLAKRLEQEKLEGEFVTKAKQFSKVVTKPEQLGPVLKRIADHSKEDYQVIEAVLKAAEEMATRADLLYKELGSGADLGGGDAWDRIEKKAEEIKKHQPEITKEAAIQKAINENPALYTEYQKELYGEGN